MIQDRVRSTTHRRGSTLKVCSSSGALDDLQLQAQADLGLRDELASVAAVGPRQRDGGKSSAHKTATEVFSATFT